GGSGKTRLAVEAAARLVETMQGAVWFVPLVEVCEARGVLEAIRDALGLPRSSEAAPMDQIAATLAERPGLLVLDNFEQVVEAGSDVVQTLRERLPGLRLLVTSRRTLNLLGEQEFGVPPMSTPSGVETPERLVLCESVKLFVDRAQAVRPDFQVTASNAAAISELCERLEGIPLALELAASRAQVLTPAQMLGQLEHRFDLLVSRRRDIAARHRTLRAALDWSYQSLAPELQAFFGRLSVFRGGWTTEAAEAVCDARNFRTIGSAPDALALLRECSLILSEEVGEQMRFRMLETLREYAGEKLTAGKEDAHLERAHAHYFFLLEETATQRLHGPDQVAWFQRLEAEHDNFRAALQWGLTTTEAPVRPRGKDSPDPLNRGNSAFTPLDPETLTPAEVALHLANGLASFWWTRGYLREGREWVEKILKLDAVQAPTEARASLLRSAGTLAEMLGDYVAAHTYLEEGIALARALGDSSQLLSLLANLGILLKQERDYARADLLLGEALALAEHLQNKMVKASVLNTLGQIAFYQGDPAKARILLENGMQLDREQENLQNISAMLCNLAILARMQEDYVGAQSYLQECLEACRSLGDQRLGLHAFETLAGVLFGQEQFAEGTRIFGAAQALRAATGIPVPPHDQEEADREIARGRAGLGPDDFEAALASGRGLNWESALAYAQQILRG
ncbi:MAG: diguanylate cyclase and serine/threonine protein kinase with repeat, partial [Chthonomonadales bacterium]|nr:diguanylate cyclase and serine/threonine protein kinase with repeat [Chthonomonadales bacterium]